MPDDQKSTEPWVPDELRVAADQVKRNEVPPKITVRQLLQYFGFQRRGFIKAFTVQEALDAVGIATDPPFLEVWIDAEISFVPKKTEEHPSSGTSGTKQKDSIASEETVEPASDGYDPTYRIGLLAAANQRIVSVPPDDDLTTAVTRMLNNDYSQLPVMRTERDLKGIISWASIGSRMALKQRCKWVRDCMDTHVQMVDASASLFSVIPIIVEHDYVLIKASDNKITGIVTASDLSLQFQQLSGPFLLLREIEQHVRKLISSKLTIDDLKFSQDPSEQNEVRSVNDLTLGNYELVHLGGGQIAGLGASQQQVEFCSLFELLDRVDRGVEIGAGDDRAVIGQQYSVVLAGEAAHRFGERQIAGTEIGDERQPTDPHHVIGGDRRQHVFRIDFGKAGDCDRMRRMQMHNGASGGALLIHDTVQKALLGRRVAGNKPSVEIELRKARRVEAAERSVGRRHQPAFAGPHADIAGGAGGQAAREDRLADRADRLSL